MKKIILNKEQIERLVRENRYPVNEETKFQSRCIDGRYQNKLKVREKELPALAFPGGDLGELALIFATGNVYGFEVDGEKLWQVLIQIIGGEENFGFHTDSHVDFRIPAGGCDHWQQIQLDPKAYHLEKNQLEFIQGKITALLQSKKNNNYQILEGDHQEGAILMIRGNWAVYPQYFLEGAEGREKVEVFVYHQTLIDERHRVLASVLVKNQAVKLYPGCDEEYLYEVLSEMTENHLMETALRLAKGLPIYQLEFKNNGEFTIVEMGKIC